MKKLIWGLAAVVLPFSVLAQTNEIRGRITDSLANPVPYAVVAIEGTYISAQTDGNGTFLLHSKSDSGCCLIVHALGYSDLRKCYDSPPPNVNLVVNQSPYMKDEVVVSATRVDNNSGVAYTNVTKDQITKENFGQDLPYVLNNQTSVVTTSDAGNGFGYTGVRIRGSDATRINVTINGIPVNDAESQGAFWVDMPDIVSSTENIQIQRGVGTSTNGAGAFGGSLNLQTELNRRNAYSDLTLSGGSFNSWRATAKAGTGIINKRWSFDLRLSQLGSDGFIDRGRSDLRSWYFSGGYYGDRLSIKAITFSGRERTYQCWNGVPQDSIAAGNYTYNPAGIYYDAAGNELAYKDQVDAYGQDYYQLHFILQGNEKWMFNWSLFGTRGKGYYEEYKEDQSLMDYGINDNSSNTNDLVRRRWLDNWYYGIVYAAHYTSGKDLSITIGGASTIYDGKHFGEVIWATGLPVGETLGGYYYEDDARKTDNNLFVKVNYAIGNSIHVFADVQARMINYSFTGLDSAGTQLPQAVDFLFVNPKAGIIAQVAKNQTVYLSFGVGNKEPNRDDFTNSSPLSRPLHETLYDVEAGWKFGSNKLGVEVNMYYMLYKNQLVLTGKVNEVGAYTRENVAESYRRGIELTMGYNITKQFNISGNATLSQNKIGEFHEFIDDYDTFVQQENIFANTDIAFSPSIISAGVFTWDNRKGINASVIGKYVGKQFLDNTSSDLRKIDPYFTLGLNASWTAIRPGTKENQKLSELRFGVQVNNLLNTMYSSNGYTYGYIYGGESSRYNYYYPQAGITIMGMVSMRFGG